MADEVPSKAVAKLKNGQTVTGNSEIWSVSSNLTDERVVQKFENLTRRVLPEEKVKTAVQKAFALDGLGGIDELIQAVCL